MDMLIWAIGLGLIIVAYIVNVKRGNRHGSHYHDGGTYHSTHDTHHSDSARHGGDWGGRDMSHDHHHGGHDSDSSGNGGGDGGG